MTPRYPRPVREVHQIEFSSHCNLKCRYCPHFPLLPREKLHMSDATFDATMDLVAFYCKQGTQTELSMTGIGEAMLHPRFASMVERCRKVIGPQRPLVLATNGILLDDERAALLARFGVNVFVSLHRPERAGIAVEIAKRHGIFAGTNSSFVTSAFNWAGTQKNWYVTAPRIQCEYLRSGWCVVLANGDITTCCMDPDGRGVFADVHTVMRGSPEQLCFGPHGLCETCHMEVPQ